MLIYLFMFRYLSFYLFALFFYIYCCLFHLLLWLRSFKDMYEQEMLIGAFLSFSPFFQFYNKNSKWRSGFFHVDGRSEAHRAPPQGGYKSRSHLPFLSLPLSRLFFSLSIPRTLTLCRCQCSKHFTTSLEQPTFDSKPNLVSDVYIYIAMVSNPFHCGT